MKFLFILLILLAVTMPLWAEDKETRLLNQLRERMEVTIGRAGDLATLSAGGFEVDYCTRTKSTSVFVYATPFEAERLKQMGFQVVPRPVVIGEDSRDS